MATDLPCEHQEDKRLFSIINSQTQVLIHVLLVWHLCHYRRYYSGGNFELSGQNVLDKNCFIILAPLKICEP